MDGRHLGLSISFPWPKFVLRELVRQLRSGRPWQLSFVPSETLRRCSVVWCGTNWRIRARRNENAEPYEERRGGPCR
jgi:hypothetical protein